MLVERVGTAAWRGGVYTWGEGAAPIKQNGPVARLAEGDESLLRVEALKVDAHTYHAEAGESEADSHPVLLLTRGAMGGG